MTNKEILKLGEAKKKFVEELDQVSSRFADAFVEFSVSAYGSGMTKEQFQEILKESELLLKKSLEKYLSEKFKEES